jgi:uncharacterized repeat protein (TIGR03803 family)
MRSKELPLRLTVVLATFSITLLAVGTNAAAQTENVLHDFTDNGTDGYLPYSGLIFDASGNLYGTAFEGGTNKKCPADEATGCGAVFELSPSAGGAWTETILHDFGNGTDGRSPVAGLIFDAAGNLYGTTANGGTGKCDLGDNSCGTVFELSPQAGGGWTEKVLYNFGSYAADGYFPYDSLIFDAAGNLYGTTFGGGKGYGTVFELSPTGGGAWTEKQLHSFTNDDGASPYANLIFDAAGNLYGTTWAGGGHSQAGLLFELTPPRSGGGVWKSETLHYFGADNDGRQPVAGLVFDAKGNLYGTTTAGGTGSCDLGCGTVFELSPAAMGQWTETVVHSFDNNGTDGYHPAAGLVFDGKGNLYSTTLYGGPEGCFNETCGTVVELSPTAGGGWTETVLYTFPNSSSGDGYDPLGSLIFDAAGNLYGTTSDGGTGGTTAAGVVFEITP